MSESLVDRCLRLVDFATSARRARWRRTAGQVIELSDTLGSLDDGELVVRGRELGWRVRGGEPQARFLGEAFALVREAARREFGYAHFPVQIVGGLAMAEGFLAEMQTGEGKTLTATLPAFVRALAGRGCHVFTVNDYLAKRDAGQMGRVFARLGLSTGCITEEMQDDARRAAYSRDVTYATAQQAGFDFLRDRLKRESSGTLPGGRWRDRWPVEGDETAASPDRPESAASGTQVHRAFHAALIDEADSILLDEARTPLIIGLQIPNSPASMALLRWAHAAADVVSGFANDFRFDPKKREATLTEGGTKRIILRPKPPLLDAFETDRVLEAVETALLARHAFQRDRDYVIADKVLSIVDESTGRVMEGRKWQDGLHQALEVKERLNVTAATGEAARVTTQTFLREYLHVAGMTGTAASAASELRRTYGLRVAVVPTHRPCLRKGLPTRVFATLAAKQQAVADEIERLQRAGRAVLVGTPSVAASESLAEALRARGIQHAVLNALHHEEEAAVVAEAGQPGRVTIATNMAGRGTDIHLGKSVAQAGGLHVIATERHSSARIDRQLIGRAARQGDPGSFQFFLSLEDELLRVLPRQKRDELRAASRPDPNGELPTSTEKLFVETQCTIERRDARHRREQLKSERQRRENHRRMGLDPCLELPE